MTEKEKSEQKTSLCEDTVLCEKIYSEEDTKRLFITPALEKSGWTGRDSVKMEYAITDGRVDISTDKREKKKFADYVLFERPNYPIAIVEAKHLDAFKGKGIQQAINYAEMLDVKFAYSTNGKCFIEHNFITGKERELSLDEFPSLEQLKQLLEANNKPSDDEQTVLDVPYNYEQSSFEPRYYQRVVINRTVQAVAQGKKRLMIVMATGTGKTYTAFQIIHRLHKSGLKKKILYLADRNILIDQTMHQDFKPFDKIMTKIEHKTINTAYEIYMALYQQLVGTEGNPDTFTQIKPDFFDLIIIDECHRGSAKEDSQWRKILTYFSSATHIGMTATPKADYEANNLEYFGEPIYTYSLLQGIQDGFLAPYKVTNCFIDLDLNGFEPEEDEVDVNNIPIEQRHFYSNEFCKTISFLPRQVLIAKRITKMLRQIGRMTKTIVFCEQQDEAETMRHLLVNENSDMVAKDRRYIMRITSDDDEGKKQLDNFISVNEPYPTIVTTSRLLETGVDCKTCGLIVIDKNISSMTTFKQIIGRGTRIRTDCNKFHFDILDFRNATQKFHDPDFDGPLEQPEPPQQPKGPCPDFPQPPQPPRPPRPPKYFVDNVDPSIATEIVEMVGADGKTMKIDSYIQYSRDKIVAQYSSLEDFRKKWATTERKSSIIEELESEHIVFDALRNINPALKNADLFDVICYVAFNQAPKTRRERADKVKMQNIFSKYSDKAREIIGILLEKYAEHGIKNLEDPNILATAPFDSIGKPQKIVKIFGDINIFKQALHELKQELYKDIA